MYVIEWIASTSSPPLCVCVCVIGTFKGEIREKYLPLVITIMHHTFTCLKWVDIRLGITTKEVRLVPE